MSTDEQLAVEYARYSTETQNSLADQHEMNQETADEISARIVATFEDEAVSRSVADRKGLLETFAYLTDHPEVTLLIIPQLDRLIGDLDQHTTIFKKLAKLGVRLYTYDGWLDYTDDDAMTKAEQESLASGVEIRRSRKRTRKSLRQKARSGRYTSRPPFGLRMKPVIAPDGTEVPLGQLLLDEKGRAIRSGELDYDPTKFGDQGDDDPTAFQWLEQIFAWMAGGDEGVPLHPIQVCRLLAAAGVLTKNGNNDWDTHAVVRIIRNRVYLGEMTRGKRKTVHTYDSKTVVLRDPDDPEIIRRTHNLGPVIDLDVWTRANAVITARNKAGQRGPGLDGRTKAHRVLHGLVFCGRCGAFMQCSQDTLYGGEPATTWRYKCRNRPTTASGVAARSVAGVQFCAGGHSLAELNVLDALRGMTPRGGEVAFVVAAPDVVTDRKQDRSKPDAAIASAEASIERIRDFADDGFYDRPEALRRIARQQAVIDGARSQLAALDAASPQVDRTLPKARRVEVATAMTDLLVDARKDHGPMARTDQFRSIIRDTIASRIARIEIDSPNVTIFVRPAAPTDA